LASNDRRKAQEIDMKIVVIGGTRHIRSETVERLRRQGHQAVTASPKPRVSTITVAPRDPGYAGRPLRELLENLWFGRFQARIGGREVHGPAARGCEDGIR
jgi:NAD(P)-dependent dehydrogenase (short-subunit alcohol dehydrogenase family)